MAGALFGSPGTSNGTQKAILRQNGAIFQLKYFFSGIWSCGVSRALQQNVLDIQHCFSTYQSTQLEKTAKKSISGTPKVIEAPFGGSQSAVKVSQWAEAHDMNVAHPDTLCESVLDANQSVWAVS